MPSESFQRQRQPPGPAGEGRGGAEACSGRLVAVGAAISASRAAAAPCDGSRWGEGVQRGGRWCSQEAWIAQGMGWVGQGGSRGGAW